MFIACSESITNPDTPGSGLLNRNVLIKNDTLLAASDTTYLQRIVTDGILLSPLQQDLIGRDGIYKAHTAIRFSVVNARDTINVLSAKMTLRLVTWRGNATGTFAFSVHKIKAAWSEATLTWKQADSTGFYHPDTVGSYSGSLGPDTQKITLNLDTAMVRGWLRSNTTSNNGILLLPTSASSIIRGIHAFDYDSTKFQPLLEIIARNTSGTVTDTTLIQIGSDTYVADANPFPLSADHIFTQAGIAYRSRLKFDVSKLPAGAIINSAELLLERDPALTNVSRFTATPQPVVQALFSDDSSNFESVVAAGSLKSGSTNTFAFDVRRQVQLWANGTNYGIVLRQYNVSEFGTLDVFAFYSNNATNSSLRPRINIKYTVFTN
jgi:hypothetical protein